LVPSFLCTKGLFKDAWHGFSAYEMRSRVIVGSNTYWISSFVRAQSSSILYYDVSGSLKCLSYAMTVGCMLSSFCCSSLSSFLFSFATDVVLFSEGSVFADKC